MPLVFLASRERLRNAENKKMRAKSITFCCETTLKRQWQTSSSHNDIEFYASEICGALNRNTSKQKILAVRYEEECWCVNVMNDDEGCHMELIRD